MTSEAQPTVTTSTGTTARRGRRVPFWDNARFACIVLVVLGHAIQRLVYDSDVAYALYLAVYAFHMPAFAIISGYFSRSGPPSRRQMVRVVTDILLPYIVFEVLWWFAKWLVEGRAEPNITQPSWTLWFLLALGIFRLVLPYLALLRWPLAWSVLISVGAGYLPNIDSTFSLSRTLGFLPFFVLGWWLRRHDVVERFGLLRRRPWWLSVGAAGLLALAGWVAWAGIDLWREVELRYWFFYDDAYVDLLSHHMWWAGAVRLATIAIGVALSAAFFSLVPRRRTPWTRLGQYTMYVYLLHSFVLYPFRESGVLRGLDPTWFWLPVMCLLSIAVATLLATRPVRWLTGPLVEPRPRWLFASPGLLPGRRNDPTGSRRAKRRPQRAG
ncbi:acyltransferase family protein [Microbacterium betulae]|uniref:Acyltransferase family protein n=1 Tax=Microbacterium betulae TaxID=2981139 RepID=A0AA97I5F9_9MICO|nr:acyltransferase family protein [Microbacterium sp. AB]WOF22047.1 acyltransferase family protein [Microbacterium sp. AB]